MIQIEQLWWPDDVGEKWRHSLKHLASLEDAITRCRRRRTAVQAGGNVGLWPRRLAASFARVITFEPDQISRECLEQNVPANVEVHSEALGAVDCVRGLTRASLGSHHIAEGANIHIVPLDALALDDVDLLQLDVEGYECFALQGAAQTIARSHPIIQVELRDFGTRYNRTDADVVKLLESFGYREVSRQPGNDVVFWAVK